MTHYGAPMTDYAADYAAPMTDYAADYAAPMTHYAAPMTHYAADYASPVRTVTDRRTFNNIMLITILYRYSPWNKLLVHAVQ